MVEIILCVLVGLTILLLIAVLFLLLRKNSKNSSKDMFDYLEHIHKDNQDALLRVSHEMDSFQNRMEGRFEKMSASFQDHQLYSREAFQRFKEEQMRSLLEFKESSSKSIQDSYTALLSIVNTRLDKIDEKVTSSLQKGFSSNAEEMKEVSRTLGQIQEAQRNLDSLKDEVSSLNGVLTNSQKRGRFGEVALESILYEVFGDSHDLYDLQHKIANDKKPDAVIYLPGEEKMVCIDSKFSFVSYEKLFAKTGEEEELQLKKEFKAALKKQIEKIRNDYILEGETSPYAIMFIPSDGIYSFLQCHDDFYEQIVCYARKNDVILTSPSTLQPILANIRMLQVNCEVASNIRNVLLEIRRLREECGRFASDWDSFARSVDSLSKKKEEFSNRVNKMNRTADGFLNQADVISLMEDK